MVRPRPEDLTFSEWKAIKTIWHTELWDRVVSYIFQMHDTLTEWIKRTKEWK